MCVRGSGYTGPNPWARFMIWKHPMRSQSGVYWNNVVAKEFMYFRVSQAPSWYYGLVCAVCFQDLLQQLNVLLIYTYCTSRRRWVIYFWKQDSQSHRTTSKCHWSACRSSTLCAVSTSNLSNRWYSEYNFWLAALSLSCDGTMRSFIFQFVVLHLQLQGFSTSASIGSNCPGISGTVPDYKNLSRVPERYVKCPGRVLT